MDSELYLHIRQALHQHGFYRLHAQALNEILLLIDYPPTNLPSFIEQYAIRGLEKLVKTISTRLQLSNHFRSHKYSSISDNIKKYVSMIYSDIKLVKDHLKKNQLKALGHRSVMKKQVNQQGVMKEERNESESESESEESMKPETIDAQVQTDINLIQDEYIIFEREPNAGLPIDDEAEYRLYLKKERKKEKERRKKNQNIQKIVQSMSGGQSEHISKESQSLQNPFIIIHSYQNKQPQKQIKNPIVSKEKSKKVMQQIKIGQIEQKPQIITLQLSSLIIQSQSIILEENKKIPQISLIEPQILENCLCKGSKREQPFFQCFNCKQKYHYSCLNISENIQTVKECSCCIIRGLYPPHKIQQVLFQKEVTDFTLPFSATFNPEPYQYQCNKMYRNYEIELRCLKMSSNPSNSKEFAWPDDIEIVVNQTTVFKIESQKERRRNNRHIVLTNQIYFRDRGDSEQLSPVKISLQKIKRKSQSSNQKEMFLFGAYFIHKQSFEELFKEKCLTLKEVDKNFFANLFESSIDEIQIDIIKCTLKDPITKNVINTPVRGTDCSHLQCFDLQSYLKIHYLLATASWKCPVCNKLSINFLEDPLQKALIAKVRSLNMDSKEVTFTKTGKVMIEFKNEIEQQEDLRKKGRKKAKQKAKVDSSVVHNSFDIRDSQVSSFSRNAGESCFSEQC